MAVVCKKSYKADIGVGVTGTMVNVEPANKSYSVPGQVFFAISTVEGVKSFSYKIEPQESRLLYKLYVAQFVYEELIKIL